MDQPSGFYLHLILFAAIGLLLFSLGYWNQYRIYNRKSEYYCFMGALLLSFSSSGCFLAILFKPEFNVGWFFYLPFLIVPAVIFNVGIGIRIVYYNWDRPGLKERIKLIFGIPGDKKQLVKPFSEVRLVFYGVAGYIITLALSLIFTAKDPLIAIIVMLSEFILITVPLEFTHNDKYFKHTKNNNA